MIVVISLPFEMMIFSKDAWVEYCLRRSHELPTRASHYSISVQLRLLENTPHVTRQYILGIETDFRISLSPPCHSWHSPSTIFSEYQWCLPSFRPQPIPRVKPVIPDILIGGKVIGAFYSTADYKRWSYYIQRSKEHIQVKSGKKNVFNIIKTLWPKPIISAITRKQNKITIMRDLSPDWHDPKFTIDRSPPKSINTHQHTHQWLYHWISIAAFRRLIILNIWR